MTGPIFLAIRMFLYFAGASLATLGVASFEPATGVLLVNVDDMALTLGGLSAYAATFAWSRLAKKNGGTT